MFDLLIKNAKVVDGTAAPWYIADVAVKGGKIVQVGHINGEAAKTVDAGRNVLAPGFIDAHSHSDTALLLYKKNESRILQGITTELCGNCGLSPIPVNPEKLDLLKRYIGFVSGDIEFDWKNAGDFFDKVEANGASTNFALMVGHGSIRLAAMGFDNREPSGAELEYMRKLTAECMEQGCFGMTTGLIYPPGIFAKNDEIIELAKVVASYGGFYKSHMRWEGDKVLQGVEDTIEVAEKAGLPAQVDHHKVMGRKNWNFKSHATVARIARARNDGLDITADQYPYTASATTMTTNVDDWAHEGGLPKLLERLKDPETRRKIAEEIRNDAIKGRRLWSRLFVSSVRSERNAWVMGKNIEEISGKLGKDPVDTIIDLLIEEEGDVGQINFGISEEDVVYIMKQPFVMIGSDGGARSLDTKNVPHPRTFGTFPRVIAKYCRDQKLFSLETAIHKMTGMTAARIGLQDRGLIKTGMWADMVLFDFDKINDTPTYTKPAVACEGILQVYVNGVLTAENGVHTGALAGKVIRRGKT
jgi:N-acyl-D-amino-acid deacylase